MSFRAHDNPGILLEIPVGGERHPPVPEEKLSGLTQRHGLRDLSSLDEKERAQYEQVLSIALDTWEKSIHAEKDGLIAAEDGDNILNRHDK